MNRLFVALFSVAVLAFTVSSNSVAQTQFQNITDIAAATGYSAVPQLGDYDMDGDLDILVSYTLDAASNPPALFRNDGNEFIVVDLELQYFPYGGQFRWADLDGDNDLDIVAAGCQIYCFNSKKVFVYRNDGADQFTRLPDIETITGGKIFSLADYNNDGLQDIELSTLGDGDDVINHSFYRNKGNFVFEKTFELPDTNGEVTWGDLNNDGWQDFVLQGQVFKNKKDGTFEPFGESSYTVSRHRDFVFDADADGDLDVITNNGVLLSNDGDGTLTLTSIFGGFEHIGSFVVADFDGDGNEDVIASGGAPLVATKFLRSNGDGTYAEEYLSIDHDYPVALAVGDMDADNDADIVFSGVFFHQIKILENGLPTTLTKPTPPANLSHTINGNTLDLSWNAATDNEQSALSYNLFLSDGNRYVIAPVSDIENGRSYYPGAANSGHELQRMIPLETISDGYYQWSVQSVDDELNASAFAPYGEFTLYRNNSAGAPTGLIKTGVTDHSVSLSWTDNSSSETSFSIERSTVDGNSGFAVIDQLGPNVTTYTNNNLLSNKVYYYRVKANGLVSAALSNVTAVETMVSIATIPSNVVVTALTSATTKIEWQYAGTGITDFVIERSFGDKNHFAVVQTVPSITLFVIDLPLAPGNTYYYRVSAVNAQGSSDHSSAVQVIMPLKEFNRITVPSLSYQSMYVLGGIAWGDYDNDAFDDIFIAHKSQLFHNNGDGTFEHVLLNGIKVDEGSYTSVGVWGDYDGDGFLDLYTYHQTLKSKLYRGHGNGTFTEVTTSISGNLSDVTNATWVDYDLDGDLDLSPTGGTYVYRNDGNDVFIKVDMPATTIGVNSTVASWADYDDDGDPDVFWGSAGKDEFFDNNGDGTFTKITNQQPTEDYNFDCCPTRTATALWTDFNNDLKLDLSVFHERGPFYVYTNKNDKLESTFSYYETEPEPWKNNFWVDYDSDGDQDLFSMGQYNIYTKIFENAPTQLFKPVKRGPLYELVASDATFSWNDYDNDGFSDLFQFDEGRTVLKNIPNGNRWLKVRLKGRTSNSSGVGAKVFVKAKGTWQRSDVTTHHSFQVQQGFMLLFGLGDAPKVDSVKILWPSGYRQYLKDVGVNQLIFIDEQDAQVKVSQGPSNLRAEVIYPASIVLSWKDRSNDETGFVVEMATGAGPFVSIGTVGANVDTYIVNDLSLGVKYSFRVKATGINPVRPTNIVTEQIHLFSEVFGGDLTKSILRVDGVSWGDPDGDGDPDLFVASESFEADAVYYNNSGVFEKRYLGNADNYTRSAQWIDYNRDGYQDLHVSVGGGVVSNPENLNDVLFKNDGAGNLVEQPDDLLAKDGAPDDMAAWGDLNSDGFVDMVVSRRNMPGIFLNHEGVMKVKDPSDINAARFLVLSDIDGDRDLDLISSDYWGYTIKVFTNDAGDFVEDIGAMNNAMGPFVLEDFDNDGDSDLMFVVPGVGVKLHLYDALTNRFIEKAGAFPQVISHNSISVGDFDNNGFMDVIVAGQVNFEENTNRIFLNDGKLKFRSVADPLLDDLLIEMVAAASDYNKDGVLDLFLAARDFFNGKRLLLKGSKNQNHWLRVKLKGLVSDKMGIGAKVRLFDGRDLQQRDIRSGAGNLNGDEQIAHFGLGSKTAIEYIKIEWPSGIDQWIKNPEVDHELIIEEAEAPGPPAPARPGNLTAVLETTGHVALQWKDNSNDERYFRIERALGSGKFKIFRNVPANTSAYTDSTFVVGTPARLEVKYRVVAVIFPTIESVSNEASVLVIAGLGDELDGLKVYPLPADDRVFIRSQDQIESVELIGVRGEKVMESGGVGSGELELKLQHISAGMYFLRIKTASGMAIRKLLVTRSE